MKQLLNAINEIKLMYWLKLTISSVSITHFIKCITLLYVVMFFVLSEANAQSFLWADGYGTHTGESNSLVKCDSKGNTYIVGYTNGGASIGDIYLRETSRILMKYNQSGEVIWVKTIGDRYKPYIHDLYIDNEDQVYLLGNSESSFPFDKETINTSKGHSGFLISVDADGQLIWQRSYNSYLRKVIVADQHIYLLGNFTQYASFNDYHLVINNSSYNGGMYFAKLDKEGDHIFSKVFVGREFNYVHMDVSKEGSFYVCGKFKGDELTIDGKVHQSSYNYSNYFITGFDSKGDLQWLSIENSDDGYLSPVDILTDKQGDIYVAGNIIGDVGGFTSQSHDYGTFLFKYSSQGKLLWQKELTTNNTIGHTIVGFEGCALAVNSDNSLFIASSFMSNFTIPDYKGDDISVIRTGRSSDIFVAKFHPLGYAQWVKVFGGGKDEWLRDMDIDKEDHINIVGKYASLNLYLDSHVINNNSGNSDPDAFAASLIDPTGIAPCPTFTVDILRQKTHLCKHDTLTLAADHPYANNYQWKKDELILPHTEDSILISAEGQYRLVINEGTMCRDSSEILTIEDKKLPISKIFHGDSTIVCVHDSVVLKVNDFENSIFQWFKDGSVLESLADSFLVVREEGMYSVFMSNESCSQSDSLFIEKLEYPEIMINADTFSYQGTPIDIYPIMNKDAKALWYYNYDVKEFSREDKITTSLCGNYTLLAKNYCGIDVDQVFVYDDHVGINDKYLNSSSLVLSPNPTNGNFYISIDGLSVGECLIEILNMKGNVVKSLTAWCNHNGDNSTPINLTTPSGMYFVRVTQGARLMMGKFIIRH